MPVRWARRAVRSPAVTRGSVRTADPRRGDRSTRSGTVRPAALARPFRRELAPHPPAGTGAVPALRDRRSAPGWGRGRCPPCGIGGAPRRDVGRLSDASWPRIRRRGRGRCPPCAIGAPRRGGDGGGAPRRDVGGRRAVPALRDRRPRRGGDGGGARPARSAVPPCRAGTARRPGRWEGETAPAVGASRPARSGRKILRDRSPRAVEGDILGKVRPICQVAGGPPAFPLPTDRNEQVGAES
jgi:hypothetical protein